METFYIFLEVGVVLRAFPIKLYVSLIQIIYDKSLTKILNTVSTGDKILTNLTTEGNKLFCAANESLRIYDIVDSDLIQHMSFKVDAKTKYATLNAIAVQNNILVTGGDDTTVRFFHIDNLPSVQYEYQHSYPIKCLHCHQQLFLSADNKVVNMFNYQTKQIVHKIYADQLSPPQTQILSAYFNVGKSFCIVHYRPKQQSYITHSTDANTYFTQQISQDQVCCSRINKNRLALGCGKGETLIYDTVRKQILCRDNKLSEIVTDCLITHSANIIAVTPACECFVQKIKSKNIINISWFIVKIIFTLLLIMILFDKS